MSRRTLHLVEKARGKNGVPPAFPQVLPSCVCSICLGHQKTLFVIAPVFKTNNYPNLGTKMNQVYGINVYQGIFCSVQNPVAFTTLQFVAIVGNPCSQRLSGWHG